MKRLLFGGCLENSKVEKLSGVVCDGWPMEEGSDKQGEPSTFSLTRTEEFSLG